MLSKLFRKRNKKLIWVYSKRKHRKHSISPTKQWWSDIDGTVIDFWRYEEIAFIDIKTKQTVLAPKNYRNKQNLKAITREWCKPRWVKS